MLHQFPASNWKFHWLFTAALTVGFGAILFGILVVA
jgi:hypothetical protein